MNKQFEAGIQSLREKVNDIHFEKLLDKFYSHSPIYAWRLGLGPLVGRYVMIISQISHKTGNPCKTSIEFFEINGIKYIANLFGVQSQWYRNILSNPRVTVQTADGTEQMVVVPVSQDEELITIVEWLLHRNPRFLQHFMDQSNVQFSRKDILKHKNDLIFLRFDPTSEPTPKGLDVDLAWIWPILLFWTIVSRPRRKR